MNVALPRLGRGSSTGLVIAGGVAVSGIGAVLFWGGAATPAVAAGARYVPLPATATDAVGVSLARHNPDAPISSIGLRAALAAVRHRDPGLASAARSVTVTFGDFSDSEYASSGGNLAQAVPAFVVTLHGLHMASEGRNSSAWNSELNVVVDASTGAIIEEFSYR